MDAYATKTEGVGGRIKESVDDFVVEEVLVDGTKASVSGVVPSQSYWLIGAETAVSTVLDG